MNIASPIETMVLGPEHNGMRMTPAEFDAIRECDEFYIYELVHGVLVVNPPPLPEERGPNEELGYWLRKYRDEHAQGSCLDATLAEERVQTLESRRRADRVIWTGLGRQPDPRKDLPTIVVEFVSAGRRNWQRDYVEKRDEYFAIGIAEYWIVDRFQRRLTVFRHHGEKVEEQVIGENDVYQPLLLPGFELPLARLLAVADRWNVD